jgi:hypothetical protein
MAKKNINHITLKGGELMTIEQVRQDHAGVPRIINGRVAVIVRHSIKPNSKRYIMGVQFWTHEMIKQKQRANTDGTIAEFLEIL